MSAVAAILYRTGAVGADRIERMLAASPHRGHQRQVAVCGTCLLGIANLGSRIESSLASEDGLCAAVTGVIDNREPLAREFEGRGVSVSSPTSASLVIAGFRTWGESLAARLRGAFAAVITDGSRLWCFRDQLGFRTLFYRDEPRVFHVATEAKQVVAGSGIPREPDLDVLSRIFYGSYDDDTPTALKGVRRLRKATMLVADRQGIRSTLYWNPESFIETVSQISYDEVHERFDELMQRAVTRSLTGNDVVSLSGGIDSPAVAAFAAPAHLEMSGRPIAALSAVYPDQPAVDERRYTEIAAEAFGIRLHTYEKRAQPLDRLLDWVRILDGPVPKILVTDAEEHFLVARHLGFSTMLSGEVAEFVVDMRGYLSAHLLWRGRLPALWRRIAAQRERKASIGGIAWQVLCAFVPGSVEATLTRVRGFYGRPDIPGWLNPHRVNMAAADYMVPARHRWRQQQLAGFLGPGLTMEANDIVQVVCDVRVRMPWADVDLWEFFLSLPAEIKFPDAWRKGLIRRLLRGRVPDVILDRKDKTVFNDSMMARVDYAALRQRLIDPKDRIDGVNYAALAERLDRQDFTINDFIWAKDLAAVHAFLATW